MSKFRRGVARGTGIMLFVATLAMAGAAYQSLGEARDRKAVPRPGQMVSVDGGRMHLFCTGSGVPTVVLEAGATGFAQTWAWVQKDLAKVTRVCSYDRAGMGWSDVWDAGHDAVAIAANLRQLLLEAEEAGPYVLVGHSLGGSLVQAYAGLYPDDVLAVGMVDPSHPDQLDRFGPDIRKQQERFYSMIGAASRLAYVGAIRAANPLGRFAAGLPESDYRTAKMFAASPKHLRTSYAEMMEWEATMATARSTTSLGDRPVVIISATENMEGMPDGFIDINHSMHGELAALSTQGAHVTLPGTDHYSILMTPEGGRRTAEVLRDLIERSKSPA